MAGCPSAFGVAVGESSGTVTLPCLVKAGSLGLTDPGGAISDILTFAVSATDATKCSDHVIRWCRSADGKRHRRGGAAGGRHSKSFLQVCCRIALRGRTRTQEWNRDDCRDGKEFSAANEWVVRDNQRRTSSRAFDRLPIRSWSGGTRIAREERASS